MSTRQDNAAVTQSDEISRDVFSDPVTYLRRWGIEAELVDPGITLPTAA